MILIFSVIRACLFVAMACQLFMFVDGLGMMASANMRAQGVGQAIGSCILLILMVWL